MTAEEREKELKKIEDFLNVSTESARSLPETILTYLNSQRETIFKEELEKRLPSDEEIKDNADKETMGLEFWSLEEWNAFITGSEWLIEYLKQSNK